LEVVEAWVVGALERVAWEWVAKEEGWTAMEVLAEAVRSVTVVVAELAVKVVDSSRVRHHSRYIQAVGKTTPCTTALGAALMSENDL